MRLDTNAVRRLRDRLLAIGDPGAEPPATDGASNARAPGHEDLTPNQRAAIDRIGPLAEALFLTMTVDGELARSECAAIRAAIDVLTDDLLPKPAVDALLAQLEEALAAQGREMRLEAVASLFALRRGDAETALTLAAAVALSDGEIADAESDLLAEMRSIFGISAARAAALLDGAPPAPR